MNQDGSPGEETVPDEREHVNENEHVSSDMKQSKLNENRL